jgi:hypothetical protein
LKIARALRTAKKQQQHSQDKTLLLFSEQLAQHTHPAQHNKLTTLHKLGPATTE